MPEICKNNCQNPYHLCYDNYLNTNACTECTGLIRGSCPKMMTNGKAAGKFLIYPRTAESNITALNTHRIRQESKIKRIKLSEGPVFIMKKLFAVCICASLSFCLSGCSPWNCSGAIYLYRRYFSSGNSLSPSDTTTVSEIKRPRVYG